MVQANGILDKGKVVLGLSGGVDSTAAALLLQEKGYEVIGLYFDIQRIKSETGINSSNDDGDKAENLSGLQRARIAAEQLGIKFIYKDVSCKFRDIVIENFCSEYMKGRTPNPCIICNPTVKFKTLIEAANEEGAYYIATGHYAGTYFEPYNRIWYIKRAASEKKDQSYMLYRLEQETISRLLLPLNEAEDKEQVRELARKKALRNAEAKDSQEICFIDDDDSYKDFLHRNGYNAPKGDFVDRDGNVLGEHQGILSYTIGQRKKLGIALGKPAFVTKIDCENNRVVLGENADLFTQKVVSDHNIMLDIPAMAIGFTGLSDNLKAKIRYAAKPAEATIQMLKNGKILTSFKEPQRAVTPGQSIVFYQGELVIGGGFIE